MSWTRTGPWGGACASSRSPPTSKTPPWTKVRLPVAPPCHGCVKLCQSEASSRQCVVAPKPCVLITELVKSNDGHCSCRLFHYNAANGMALATTALKCWTYILHGLPDVLMRLYCPATSVLSFCTGQGTVYIADLIGTAFLCVSCVMLCSALFYCALLCSFIPLMCFAASHR